jgi:hypothetical protein
MMQSIMEHLNFLLDAGEISQQPLLLDLFAKGTRKSASRKSKK